MPCLRRYLVMQVEQAQQDHGTLHHGELLLHVLHGVLSPELPAWLCPLQVLAAC